MKVCIFLVTGNNFYLSQLIYWDTEVRCHGAAEKSAAVVTRFHAETSSTSDKGLRHDTVKFITEL